MSWIAVGVTAASAISGAVSSRNASRRQRDAANRASEQLGAASDANLADLAPYRNLGSGAVDKLSMLLGLGGDPNDPMYGSLMRRFSMNDYMEDPGYQFRLSEGEKGINRNALAAGRYNSGATLKALQGYNSNLASQEFGNAFNRWRQENQDLFGRGTGAAAIGERAVQSGNAGRMAAAGGTASNTVGAGNAQAAGTIGVGNAISGGIGQGIDWWQGQQAVNGIRNRGGGGTYGGWRSPWPTGEEG